jgi:methyltransferase (TIGR00027 family)
MGRALETKRRASDRLFEDPYALTLLPAFHRALVRLLSMPLVGPALLKMREREIPGVIGNLLCRTRFIDDALRRALQQGMEQVLVLGAGLDSRAYRIETPKHIRFFEVDHPDTQAWKRQRTQEKHLGNGSSGTVCHVPVDFQRDNLEESMAAAGFRRAKTVVIWEGVTQYIGAEAVDTTFDFLARATEPGSKVVFTYIHRGLLDGSLQMPGTRKLIQELERRGEPWCFGIDPSELAQYLFQRGFRLVQDVGAADYQRQYLAPSGRKMNLFGGERVAVAEVLGQLVGPDGMESDAENSAEMTERDSATLRDSGT